ncbi:MAG TPA: 50S ribosomal protein L10 [Desulfurella acetivorans]|uniref:Large ribosomal subunit protein uL10 n=1 Tax=Desulfurella acetivorans TaxID=33002 RepID=A0A7C6A6R6_DESAE|nr:50S ribosomal protein L10 [Desulfurella acetivorans]
MRLGPSVKEGVLKKGKKIEIVSTISKNLEKAQAVFLVDYSGVDVKKLESIREQVKELGDTFSIIKNTLVAKATQDTKWSNILSLLEGPNAFAISYNDPIALAKLLLKAEQSIEKLQLKSAVMYGNVFNHDQIEAISKLPSRGALLAMLLGVLNAPTRGLVSVLAGVLRKPLYALNAIKEQKSK